MPTEPESHLGRRRRFFTGEELRALGMSSEEHFSGWSSPHVVDLEESVDSHGTAVLVTFRYEDSLWRVCVGYHHESWESTNDLKDFRLEALEVEAYVTTRYRQKRV